MAIGLVGAIAFLLMMSAPLVLVLIAKAQVSAAADLAALAAADVRVGIVAGFPCEEALRVALANGVQLVSCEVDGLEVSVSVVRPTAGFTVEARATAGPPRQPSN